MKGTKREVIVCDVETDSVSGEHRLVGGNGQSESLVRETISATRAALVAEGWHVVGSSPLYNGREVDVWEDGAAQQKIAVYENVKWMLWVDLEGFGHLYRDGDGSRAIWGLRCLMKDLHRIGSKVYPGHGERLFIHQVGDGFIMKPDFGDVDLLRPIAIATALLRAALMRGSCLKVGIGLGGLADVQGCYSKEVMNGYEDGRIFLGSGLMTIFPVMGDGLIDSHSVSERASGPLLIVRRDLLDAIPPTGVPVNTYLEHAEIDWIHSSLQQTEDILRVLGAHAAPPECETALKTYLASHTLLPDAWRKSAQQLVRGY